MKTMTDESPCPGCRVLNHLEAIGECFAEMAENNPEIVTREKLLAAGQHLNSIAALIADYEGEKQVQ
jgi:hypothetical protein